jgi:hypothetical protein
MKSVLMIVVLATLFCNVSFGQDDKEPADLAALRKSYESQVKQATEPLARAYLQNLDKLKKKYGAAGDIKSAALVQEEMDRVDDSSDGKSVKFSCSATSSAGTQIGEFREGQKVKIEYVTGKWSITPNYSVSPDDAKGGPKEEWNNLSKAQLCKVNNNGSLSLLEMIPYSTKKHPFVYTCQEDCTLAIRINDAGQSDNSGSVVYKVTSTR